MKKSHSVVVIVLVALFVLLAIPMAAFLALPFLLSHLPGSQTGNKWTMVSSDPPKFTIEMPGNPERQVVSQPSPNGGVNRTVYLYGSRDRIATYSACIMPFRSKLGADSSAAEVAKALDKGLDSYVALVKGQILYRKTVALGKYFGREQAVEFDSGDRDRAGQSVTAMAVCKTYFVGDSVLTFVVMLNKNDKDRAGTDGRITRFFDSLKLKELEGEK